MKLIVAIVHHDDAGGVVDSLLQHAYRTTRLQSSGGFLKKSNATILVGVDDAAVDDVISIIRANCKARSQVVDGPPPGSSSGSVMRPRQVDLRAAIVFVVPIDQFDRV